MVKTGIVGIGFMGVTHFKSVQKLENAEVVALCDTVPKRLEGDWRDIRGNIGESGGVQDLTGIRKYTSLDDIIDDPDIDILQITLPTFIHHDAAITALKKGKHVMVEKPIALSVKNADEMVSAAEKMDRVLAVGQVLRFFPEFAFVKQAVDSGEYGKLLAAHFKRIISKPDWGEDNWFADPAKSGGIAVDLHIHDADFVHYLCGIPDYVCSHGIVEKKGGVDYLNTQYIYEGKDLCITAQSGALNAAGLVFEQGYDVFLEKATIEYNSSWGENVAIYTQDGEQKNATYPPVDGYFAEIKYVMDCLDRGVEPAILSGKAARDSLMLCLKECESVKSGEKVRVC